MKNNKEMKKGLLSLLFALALTFSVQAGNPDRSGSAGTAQLLINPWAGSSGLSLCNMASTTGIEAMFSNVAGLTMVDNLEISFSNTNYLVGTDIKINAFGFAKKMGESAVLGISMTSMNFGENLITEVGLPEGGIGYFTPRYSNLAIAYAKEFSNSIYGGMTVHILSESISNVKAQGVAIDAAIRYITGERDNVRFGISLKNVGPAMRYKGDGLAISGIVNGESITVSQRVEKGELPTLVNIGLAYDFLLGENLDLTANGQFTSNSFIADQYGLGLELAFKERFYLRGGYLFEAGLVDSDLKASVYAGPSAGLSLDFNAGEKAKLGFDYSYRATNNNFGGVHSIGLHLQL